MTEPKRKRGRPRTKPIKEYDDDRMTEILVSWLTSAEKKKKTYAQEFRAIHGGGIGAWWRQLDEPRRCRIESAVIARVKRDIYELYAEVRDEFKSATSPTSRKADAVVLGILISKMGEIDRLHSSFLERSKKGTPVRSENSLNVVTD